MERNWLIRTAQNQILGPVAKAKLLEFIQKGALGAMDEVCSGNGYWFALKEKDLVEKYVYGDIPQGYNPIAEAPSVLARRENPDRTTSINTAPPNKAQPIKENLQPGLVPAGEDLDFPDITVVAKKPALPVDDDTKLPASDDLEFPDVTKISSAVKESFLNFTPIPSTASPSDIVVKLDLGPETVKTQEELKAEQEAIILPPEDDLAFPDLGEKTTTKVEKGKVDLSHQYTRTVALDSMQMGDVLPDNSATAVTQIDTQQLDNLSLADAMSDKGNPFLKKADKQINVNRESGEDRKLLHDRKPKAPIKTGAALRDPTREVHHKEVQPEPLKKRNDNYLFFILVILILIIVAIFFYFKEILNKPLPV